MSIFYFENNSFEGPKSTPSRSSLKNLKKLFSRKFNRNFESVDISKIGIVPSKS